MSEPRLDDYDGRKPPQALDIEEAVLGAMLVEPEAASDMVSLLAPECFYKKAHRQIFLAMADLARSDNAVDILTVSDELERRGELEEVGGTAFVSQLSTKVASAAHVAYHARVLQQKYRQREMIAIAYGIIHDAYENEVSVDEVINTAQDRIFQIEEQGSRSSIITIRAALGQTLDRIEENQVREDGLSGLASGYVNIDRVTFGWQPGDLVIIAARPSVGKTAFALTMARNMAVDHHIPVAFFSTEMSSEQLMTRLLVSEAGITADKLRGAKKMTQQEWRRLHEAIGRLEKAPISLDITGSISIHEFRAKARRQQAPQLSDLRDSGSIEQDADIVMFLHRPEYYGMADTNSPDGETNVIFAKHRNGEVGEVQMRFLKSECRFVDYNEPYVNLVPSRMNQ